MDQSKLYYGYASTSDPEKDFDCGDPYNDFVSYPPPEETPGTVDISDITTGDRDDDEDDRLVIDNIVWP